MEDEEEAEAGTATLREEERGGAEVLGVVEFTTPVPLDEESELPRTGTNDV